MLSSASSLRPGWSGFSSDHQVTLHSIRYVGLEDGLGWSCWTWHQDALESMGCWSYSCPTWRYHGPSLFIGSITLKCASLRMPNNWHVVLLFSSGLSDPKADSAFPLSHVRCTSPRLVTSTSRDWSWRRFSFPFVFPSRPNPSSNNQSLPWTSSRTRKRRFLDVSLFAPISPPS